ncbi:hypothetical protein BpHYR1_001285, partial [Brachionus plicatilis]
FKTPIYVRPCTKYPTHGIKACVAKQGDTNISCFLVPLFTIPKIDPNKTLGHYIKKYPCEKLDIRIKNKKKEFFYANIRALALYR